METLHHGLLKGMSLCLHSLHKIPKNILSTRRVSLLQLLKCLAERYHTPPLLFDFLRPTGDESNFNFIDNMYLNAPSSGWNSKVNSLSEVWYLQSYLHSTRNSSVFNVEFLVLICPLSLYAGHVTEHLSLSLSLSGYLITSWRAGFESKNLSFFQIPLSGSWVVEPESSSTVVGLHDLLYFSG